METINKSAGIIKTTFINPRKNLFLSNQFLLPFSVFLIALGMRLYVTYELAGNSPFFDQPIIDAWHYDNLARALSISWHWPEPGAFLQPPGYPYFLATVYRIFGTSYLWVRIVQATLGAFTCLLIADLGRLLTQKPLLGWLSGLIAALYGPLIYFELDLLATGLTLFLSVTAFRLLLSFLISGRTPYLFFSGLCYGFAVICWPLAGSLAIGTMIYLTIRSKKQPSRVFMQLFFVGLGLCLSILPVSLHNYQAGTHALISTNGAINFYAGNNPDWQITSMVRPGYEWEKLITLPFRLHGADEIESDGYSSAFYHEVKAYIIEQPWQFMRSQLTKIYQLLNGYEIINPTDPYFFKQYSSLLNALIFNLNWLKFPFGLLLPLAIIGSVYGFMREKRNITALLCIHLATAVFGLITFFISSRYRLLLLPFLIIYAALGGEAVSKLRILNKLQAVSLFIVVIVFYVLANLDLLGLERNYSRPEIRSHPYFALGRVLIRQGQYQEAILPLKTAVAIDPCYADAWVDLGRARFMTGDKAGAIKAMQIAYSVSPDYPLPLYNLARLYDEPRGSVHLAIRYYTSYLRIADKYFEANISGPNSQRLNKVKERLQMLTSK